MAEPTNEMNVQRGGDYIEDEFGLALKGYLIVRAVFYIIGVFMILGAVLDLAIEVTTFGDLVSNATALASSSPVLNDNFNGLQLCMIVQAVYTVVACVCTVWLYVKRAKLPAIIDLVMFVVFAAVFFAMGSFDILFNGSAWLLYFLLNPVISFIALFAGKHFPYMPMI